MFKKLISIFLTLSIVLTLFATISVSAAVIPPGPATQSVELGSPVQFNNATVSGDKLIINDGSAKYEFIQDFDALSVTFKYVAQEDVDIVFKTDLNAENITLLKDKTELTHTLVKKTRAGSNTVEISTKGNVTITEITLNKIDWYTVTDRLTVIVDYNDYDEALQSAVVVAENSTIVKVNGAKRQVDYDNQSEYAINHDGKLYIPVKTAARAFSLYYEEYSDLNYVYMSNDYFEFYCKENECYSINNAVKKEIENPLIYRNGKAWIHVRFIAEELNKTVGYRDGIAIFDDRLCVKRILENDSIFEELKEEMNTYNISVKQSGTEYHVSKAVYASDNNNGTEKFPFATIQKAADVAKAGDTVIIHQGIYRETVIPKNNGTAVNPIIFKAADGEEVTVSAMEKINNFVHYKDNIYCTVLPNKLGQGRNFIVYNKSDLPETYDYSHLPEGRHPNSNTSTRAVTLDMVSPDEDNKIDRTLFPVVGDIWVNDEFTGETSRNNLNYAGRVWADSDIDLDQDKENYWKGATINALHGAAWTMSSGTVVSSTKGHLEIQDIKATNPYASYGLIYYIDPQEELLRDYAYLTNHINTVDMPGEWFVDKDNILYIIPPEGVGAENLEVEAKQRQRVWDLRNKEYISLVNINTIGGGITMADAKMCVVNGGTHKYISHWNSNPAGHNAYHDTAADDPNGAPRRGECGEYISGENNAWINSVIDGSANAGIFANGVYQYIENNEVYNTSYMGSYPSGITIDIEKWIPHQEKRGGITVVNNTVKYAGRACYYNSQNFGTYNDVANVCFPTIANDVSYNEFGYGMVCARDGGVTYAHGIVAGNDRVKSKMHHNVVYAPVSQDEVNDNENTHNAAFYYDTHSVYDVMYSNVTFNTTEDERVKLWENKAYTKYSPPNSYIESFNGEYLGYRPDGAKSIKSEDYPLDKPFKFGKMDIGERMMANYNKFTMENVIYAGDCSLKGGAYIDETDIVRFTGIEDSIETATVILPEGNKEVQIYLTGDKYSDTTNTFTLKVKKNGEEVYRTTVTMGTVTAELNDVFNSVVYIPDTVTGEVTIELSASEQINGISKLKINSIEGEIPESFYPTPSYIIDAGSLDDWIQNSSSGITVKRAESVIYGPLAVSNTWQNTLIYNERYIPDNVNAMRLYLSSSLKYCKDGTVNVYVDGYDKAHKIGTGYVGKTMEELYPGATTLWTMLPVEVELNKEISEGYHTFYIEFRGDGFSSDFRNLLLYNK